MTPSDATSEWPDLLAGLEPPVLILSTVVGRGMHALGEALRERFPDPERVHHAPIEHLLPGGAVTEDLRRYKFISNRLTPLLYLVYKCPLFYYRKFARERWVRPTDLSALEARITELGARSVVCVSHRAAFWASSLKWRRQLSFALWDLLGEYGSNLGYRYLFWEAMDGFLSPVGRGALGFALPEHVRFIEIGLPARRAYEALAAHPGDRRSTLLVCGYWGQGPFRRVIGRLRREAPGLTVHVVCGDNRAAFERLRGVTASMPGVHVHGAVDSLAPILRECGSVITKPGISTLVEAHAAGRQIFLLKGMPVAEANNARFAERWFGARWFTPRCFREWCES